MAKYSKLDKHGNLIIGLDDYWQLVKETDKHLYYLSKTKILIKKEKLGNYKTKQVEMSKEEAKKFNKKKLWEKHFGEYQKKYGIECCKKTFG